MRRHKPANITIHPAREFSPVTLMDGRVVDSYSEEWREECEARAVLRFPALQKRRDYLEHVEQKRGKDAADRLKALMLLLWRQA